MTVQQERPTTVAEPTAVRVPEPREAAHDQRAQAPVPAPPRGWGSVEDRTMGRWLMVMAVCLGAYVSVFLFLGVRVFG